MILDVVQTRKELREAEFKILRGCVNVGSVFLKGTLGSIDANVILNLFGVTYELHRDTWQVSPDPKMIKYYRPYNVSILPRAKQLGVVTYAERKLGLFKTRTYLSFTSDSDISEGYTLGMGKEGLKMPVYLKNKLIAEIDSDNIIDNECYKYRVSSNANGISMPIDVEDICKVNEEGEHSMRLHIQKGSSGAKVLNTFIEIEKADSVNGKYYNNVSIIEE